MPDGSIQHLPAMDLLATKLDSFKRKAWFPITVTGDGERNASKFAGHPWLNADESYPLCSMCHKPLRFFLQLNLDQLPSALGNKFGNGILQLFYCTNEDRMCESNYGWEPFSDCKLVRIIQPTETTADVEVPKQTTESSAAIVKGEFLPQLIVDWKELDAYPDWADVEEFQQVQLSQAELNGVFESEEFAAVLADYPMSQEVFRQKLAYGNSWAINSFMLLFRMHPPEADRLAGYPRWVQEVEYPNCPVCDRLMDQLVFEFASDDHVPFLWGDVGTGYFLQCPDHLEQVMFTWQCG